ncbi:MAG: UbiX family flavin prenyltransferase, partial [Bacteroidetes bacterium]|nr:UbiX family flavin prenyltransferase [Bacteroidota bacterium]
MSNQGKTTAVPQTQTKALIKDYNGNGKNVILGISGTSGAIYGLRMLRALLMNEFNVDLIVTEYAHFTLFNECGVEINQSKIQSLFPEIPVLKSSVILHNNYDIKSEIFANSYKAFGMIVCPCAMNFVSGIANGESDSLIEKSADHALSYSTPMIIVPRETPINRIQLRNMIKILDAGGKIIPAMPSFEDNPEDFNDLADYIAGKVLDMLCGNRD